MSLPLKLPFALPEVEAAQPPEIDVSAALQLSAPQVVSQANRISDTYASLQLLSAAVGGNVGTSTADTSALLLLTSPKTSGQAEAIEAAVSASLQITSPTIASDVSSQAMSVALKLAAPQVSGRSQLHPVAGGQIVTGALSLAATVDPVDIAIGRPKVGALGLTASITKPSSAQGSVKTGNLVFGAQIYHVAEATGSGLQVGALSLSCSLMSLNRLASADVVVTDAMFAGISVDDALHVHAVFAD